MATQDDLRGDLEASFDAAPLPETTVTLVDALNTGEAPVTEAKEGRDRDHKGRFAGAEKTAIEAEVKTVDGQTEAPKEAPVIDTGKAPSSWTKESAEKFALLDPEIQAQIHKRETDFHKGYKNQFEESPAYKEMAPLAETGKQYQAITSKYVDNFKQYGIDGTKAVDELFRMDHDLRHAPPAVKNQKALQLLAHYGIDLSQQYAPDVARLQNEMYALKQQNEQILQSKQNDDETLVNTEIESFRNTVDKDVFDAVRGHMAALMKAGRADTLQDAFDQAQYANPATRQTLLEQQLKAERDKAQVATQTQRAKSANVSVKGSSPASGAATGSKGSLRDDLEAAFNQS